MKTFKKFISAFLLTALMLTIFTQVPADAVPAKAASTSESSPAALAGKVIAVVPQEQATPQISTASASQDVNFNIIVNYNNTTTDKDWIGIYKKGTVPSSNPENASYAYKYATGGSGSVTFTQQDVINYQWAPAADRGKPLTEGEYQFILLQNDGYVILDTLDFTLTDEVVLNAPAAVAYNRTSAKAGYADGTVTITPPQSTANICNYVLYWGDANGKLADYNAIVTLGAGIKTYSMVKNTYIPENATRLMAYSSNGLKESTSFAAFYIPASDLMDTSGLISKFQVISDIHVTSWNGVMNARFGKALRDIAATAPDSKGIFTVGDNVDSCQEVNYNKLQSIVAANSTGLPGINYGIGNHEYFENVSNQLINALTCTQKAARFLEKTNQTKLYYDKYIDGQHFIVLGSDQTTMTGNDADISNAQFTWLESKLAETKNKDVPIFLFLHQSMADTVAGSIGGKTGQGWNGMKPDQDARLKSILTKYPQVFLFNGHSHWDITSPHEMYDGGTTGPSIFNTGAVCMLWTDAQEEKEGSQGLYVETYPGKVLIRGRDFENNKWIPSAAFVVELNNKYAAVEAASTSLPTPAPGPISFTDAKASWAYDSIMKLASAGILNGYNDGTIRPDANTTKAEFISMIMRMVKQEPKTTASFSDTTASAWYMKALSLAVEKGWIVGRGDGTCGPDEKITREETMVIISRLLDNLGVKTTYDSTVLIAFKDTAGISVWARSEVEKLVGLGIIKGSDNMLNPKARITRAEIFTILVRIMEKYINK